MKCVSDGTERALLRAPYHDQYSVNVNDDALILQTKLKYREQFGVFRYVSTLVDRRYQTHNTNNF